MSLYSLQRSELKEVFDAVEDAFSNLGIDYYVIGALARLIIVDLSDRKPLPVRQLRTTTYEIS